MVEVARLRPGGAAGLQNQNAGLRARRQTPSPPWEHEAAAASERRIPGSKESGAEGGGDLTVVTSQ